MAGIRGRKSNAQKLAEQSENDRQSTLDKVDQIALKSAENAMQVLVDAISGEVPVSKERLSAAQSILDRVIGRPGTREQADESVEQVVRMLKEVRELRTK